jgi:hypothetical protein
MYWKVNAFAAGSLKAWRVTWQSCVFGGVSAGKKGHFLFKKLRILGNTLK